MYKRPVHIHIMDVTPEYSICYNQSISEHLPIRLSYEGSNHYNALFPKDHQFHKSRPGVQEMMVLSSTFLRKINISQDATPDLINTAELNMRLKKKLAVYLTF